MAKARSQYRCSECRHISAKWVGRCPECGTWGTVDEVVALAAVGGSPHRSVVPSSPAVPISSIDPDRTRHFPTGITELDRVLGGGVVPVSAVVANADILGVLHPGEHGSTFGGNPMAAAVGTAVVEMLATGEYQRRATELGKQLHARLEALIGHGVLAVRGMGLWAGVDIDPELGTGKHISMLLAQRGVLVKDTHGSTLRFAPPLVITDEEIDWAIDQFTAAMDEARVENMKRTS